MERSRPSGCGGGTQGEENPSAPISNIVVPATELLMGTNELQMITKNRAVLRRPCVLCAEHVRQLEGESPFHNLMEVK